MFYQLAKGDNSMNMSLIELGENVAAVSNENSGIKIVNKSNSNHTFEEVLLLENKIENLKKELEEHKDELLSLRSKSIWGILMDFITYGGIISLAVFVELFIVAKLFVIALFFWYCKGMSLVEYGTIIGRRKRKKVLLKLIEELEVNIPKLEKDLSNMKESVNYCEVPNICKKGTSKYAFDHKVNYEMDYSFLIKTKVSTEIMVKRLVPRNNEGK